MGSQDPRCCLPLYQGQNDHGRLRDGHGAQSSMSESLLLEVLTVWTGCHSILLRRGRQDNVNNILDHVFHDSPYPLGGYAGIHNRLGNMLWKNELIEKMFNGIKMSFGE